MTEMMNKTGGVIAKEGKYLTFALGNEEFGLEILRVREIIGLMEITAIPYVPHYAKGVINLRGKVIPVIDLRLKFNMEAVPYVRETCIIVLSVQDTSMGIIVDRVCEVMDITQENIEPPPVFGSAQELGCIIGVGKVGDKVKLLLDINKVLSEDLGIVGNVGAKGKGFSPE